MADDDCGAGLQCRSHPVPQSLVSTPANDELSFKSEIFDGWIDPGIQGLLDVEVAFGSMGCIIDLVNEPTNLA